MSAASCQQTQLGMMPVNASVVVTTSSKIQIIKSLQRAVVVATINKHTDNAQKSTEWPSRCLHEKYTAKRSLLQGDTVVHSNNFGFQECNGCKKSIGHGDNLIKLLSEMFGCSSAAAHFARNAGSGCNYMPPISKEPKQA